MSKKLMEDDELKKISGGSWGKNEGTALVSGLSCLVAVVLCEKISSKSYYKKRSGLVPVDFAGLMRPFIYAIGTVASVGVGLTVYTALTEDKNKENI